MRIIKKKKKTPRYGRSHLSGWPSWSTLLTFLFFLVSSLSSLAIFFLVSWVVSLSFCPSSSACCSWTVSLLFAEEEIGKPSSSSLSRTEIPLSLLRTICCWELFWSSLSLDWLFFFFSRLDLPFSFVGLSSSVISSITTKIRSRFKERKHLWLIAAIDPNSNYLKLHWKHANKHI